MSIFRKLATKKVAEVVEIAADQVKPHVEVLKTAATNKTGIFANIVKGLLCVAAGLLIIRELGNGSQESSPSNIVINNYIYKEAEYDQKSE